MIDIFHRAGVLKMLEGGHIAGRTGDWSSQFAPYVPRYENGKKKLVQYPMESEQAVNFYRQFIPSLAAHLKEAYPKVLYAQHIADEPTSDNIKSYVAIARFVKQQCPDIKIIEACHTHDLENILDIWVPQLNFYKEGYDFYRERQNRETKRGSTPALLLKATLPTVSWSNRSSRPASFTGSTSNMGQQGICIGDSTNGLPAMILTRKQPA